jgi:hypothetical protein
MPLNVRVTSDGVVLVTVKGVVTLDELKEQLFPILETEGACGPDSPIVVDARESDGNPSLQEIRRRAAFYVSLKGRLAPKLAVVVEKPHHVGLVDMMSTYAERSGYLIYSCKDLEDAFAWARAGREGHGTVH